MPIAVRERRKIFTVFMNFNDKIPQKPQEEVITNLRLKYNEPEREKELAQVCLSACLPICLSVNQTSTGVQYCLWALYDYLLKLYVIITFLQCLFQFI